MQSQLQMPWQIERDENVAANDAYLAETQRLRAALPQPYQQPAPDGLRMQQLELFNFNDELFPFVNQYITGMPDYLSKYFVKRYMRIFSNAVNPSIGRREANTWIRTTMEKGILHRLENVMKRYPSAVAVNYQKFGRVIGLDEFSDEQVENSSKTIAHEVKFLINEFQEKYIEKRAGTIDDENEIQQIINALYKKVAYYTLQQGVTPPHYDTFQKGLLDDKRMDTAILKMQSQSWWHSRLLRLRNVIQEHACIAVGQVQKKASPYVSYQTLQRWKEQKRKNREFFKQMELVNVDDDSERIGLDEMFYKTVSNPSVRRCELMVRMRGFEETAKAFGYAGEFYTLTAPSAYHAVHSQGGFVKKWNFSSPIDTHRYLCNVFARIRSSLDRKGVKTFGFRVVEPHHDGTPHWHLLLFMEQEHVQIVRDTFRHYALLECPDEPGAAEHRFTAKAIDWDKGSATGYIAKYIAKNIDGYACEDDKDEETGESLRDMAKNVSAWASHWRIRQFQQIGGAPVTVWRELRRKHGEPVNGDQSLSELITAADVGDWQQYINLQGGPFVKRNELQARTAYEDRKPNQFGEISKKIIGFFNQKLASCPIFTRLKQYQLVKKTAQPAQATERSEANISARSAPWSSVNNCTEQKISNSGVDGRMDLNLGISARLSGLISKKIGWILNKKIRLTEEQLHELDKNGEVRLNNGRILSAEYGEVRFIGDKNGKH